MNNFINPFIYINSSRLNKSMKNSVYDLYVKDDKLFVPDFKNNKLIIYGLPDRNILSTYNIPMPHGIEVDDNGKVYICSYKENSIYIIDNNSISCEQNFQLDYPISIVVKNDFIIIANWGNKKNGNLIISFDGLNSFDLFGQDSFSSKPHALFVNSLDEIIVIYRNSPSVVVYDINGKIKNQKKFLNNFDPLSIIEYKSHYLIANYLDSNIYFFDNSFNSEDLFFSGGLSPTNFSIWNNLLFISEEKSNRIISVNLKDIDCFVS